MRALSTRFHATCDVAMSRQTGSPPLRAKAKEIGFVPKYIFLPPWGTTTELECVMAMPTRPSRAAMRV